MRYSDSSPFPPNSNPGNLLVGPAIDFRSMNLASLAAQVAGGSTVSGTLKIQVSNDVAPASTMMPFTPTNWADLPGASINLAQNGNAVTPPMGQFCAYWIRAAWVPDPTAAGGTILAQLHCCAPAF